jgi:hypothetical protein
MKTFFTKRSILTGKVHTMSLNIDSDNFKKGLMLWQSGISIQNAFLTLSEHEREFVLSGITQEEWDYLKQ